MRPTSDEHVRVVVSAPIRLYREGLAEILTREDDIDVVGTSRDAEDAFSSIGELGPDVLLFDASAQRSIEDVRRLASAAPELKVVVLGLWEEERDVIAYAEAGVSGFVANEDSPADLLAALRSAARGELCCSPGIAGTLLRRVTTLAAERHPPPLQHESLTRRELEVFRLMDEGLSNKQIASLLHIELATVKHHVHHILEKLSVGRRAEAVALARQHRLLAPGG